MARFALLLAWFRADGALLDIPQVVASTEMYSDDRQTMSEGAADKLRLALHVTAPVIVTNAPGA